MRLGQANRVLKLDGLADCKNELVRHSAPEPGTVEFRLMLVAYAENEFNSLALKWNDASENSPHRV